MEPTVLCAGRPCLSHGVSLRFQCTTQREDGPLQGALLMLQPPPSELIRGYRGSLGHLALPPTPVLGSSGWNPG